MSEPLAPLCFEVLQTVLVHLLGSGCLSGKVSDTTLLIAIGLVL